MLSRAEMLKLVEGTATEGVLSVYVTADAHDPANRRAWRIRLDNMLDEAAAAAAAEDAAAMRAARRLVEGELGTVRGFLPGVGWAAFATADRLVWSGTIPAPIPDMVRWRPGPVLWPLQRAQKQLRPVVVALIDSRRARVLEYSAGAVREILEVDADPIGDHVAEHPSSKRASTHSGTRGETGTDAARRAHMREASRLSKEVAAAVLNQAGEDGLVVVGGTREAGAALRQQLDALPAGRLLEDASLHLGMSVAEVQEAVERAASAMTERLQADAVEATVEQAASGGRGALGIGPARHAAEAGQVEQLLITASAARRWEEEVEGLIAACLQAGGTVEEVGGAAADVLDARGEGVGAVLRYARGAAPPLHHVGEGV